MAKTKLTPALQAEFCAALASGLVYDGACDLVGINRATFYRWTTDRPDMPQAHRDFCDAIKEARAKRDEKYVRVIREAAESGTWQAAAWFLERTNRAAYGRNETVELTGKDGGPVVQHVTGDAAREKVTAIISDLASRRAA